MKGAVAALLVVWLGGGGIAPALPPGRGDKLDETGTLDLKSDPAARITIDEKETGQVTPATLALTPGHHQLLLVTLDGKRQRSIGFMIEAHQTTHLSIHLSARD